MVNPIYAEMQTVASELLAEFAQGEIAYIEMQAGSGPADAPGEPLAIDYPVNGAARGVRFKYVDGTNVVATDMQVTFNVQEGVTPDITGFIRADGTLYKVVSVKTVPPVGVPIAHIIIFRK